MVRPLHKYLIDILKLYMACWHASSFTVDLVPCLVSNIGNLHNLLLLGLDSNDTDLRESILGIIMLNDLNLLMHRRLSPLMLRLPDIISRINDHELNAQFITGAFESKEFYSVSTPEMAMEKALEHFRQTRDRDEEGDTCTSRTEKTLKYAFSSTVDCNSGILQRLCP
jgi:hypothetical protein